MSREAISVSALNRYAKALLERDEVLSQIWVEGEISSLKIHEASGHMYFRLVENKYSVKCVMFRSSVQKLKFLPKDGQKVLLNCSVSLYEVSGDFQLYGRDMVEKGAGDRQSELDKLKEKLEKEGLFDEKRKRSLPTNPSVIGVITSASGAVIQDIRNVLSRRNPFVEVHLYPANVQGAGAVQEICSAIQQINAESDLPDLVIIARGGGSKDDLWIFNEEVLVRTAATLKVPFISAVGHEIDFTLLDFVSDRRAPTPSAAAELSVPNIPEIVASYAYELTRLDSILHDRIQLLSSDLDTKKEAFVEAGKSIIEDLQETLDRKEDQIRALSPLHVLERGFAFVRKEGHSASSVEELKNGDSIEVVMKDGSAIAEIMEIKNGRQIDI